MPLSDTSMGVMETNKEGTMTPDIKAWTIKPFANGRKYNFRRGYTGWVFKVQFGPGAGYVKWNEDRTKVLVAGRTLYVGWRSGSREWARRFRGIRSFPLEIGLTRNGNKAPYA